MESVYQQHYTPTTHKNITRAQVLRAALAYAGKGIPVFPCKPGAKEPLTRNGFKDATTDARRITAWWNRWPEANIGIPTGERSGIISLDVDTYKPGAYTPEDVERELGPLPATKVVRTGRGGLQYLFAHPEGEELPGSTENTLGPGVCVKAKGGYVVAPPSVTEGPYTVLDDLPLVDAPEWLLEALRRPHRPAHGETEGGISTKNTAVGANKHSMPSTEATGARLSADGPIPQGQRNWSLYRYGCALRAQGFDQAAILEELGNINARLCKPPLDAGEVERIASSAAKHQPGNASPGPSTEVLEALEGIEAVNLWGRTWKGQGFKTPRSVMVVLIEEARRHGQKTKAGVRVSISVRALALAAGVSKKSLTRSNGALDKLKDAKLIRSVKGSGTKSGAYVLTTPVAGCTHSTTGERSPSSGYTLRRPHSPRLRYNKPVYESMAGVSLRVGTVLRLGKSAENVIDILERDGGRMSVAEIGAALGIKNHRDLSNRALPRLEAAGVVECSADGVKLRPGWLSALNRKREADQELDDYERDKAKYAEESRVYALKLEARKLERVGVSLEEIAAELRVGTEDVYRLLDIARPLTQPYEVPPSHDGFVEELEPVPEREDRMDHIESFDFDDEEPVEDFEELETKPLPALAVAIVAYLDGHPDDRDQSPYWLGATCWANDLYPVCPSPADSMAAVKQIGRLLLVA